MGATKPSGLSMIMAKDAAGELRLWACRGAGKGCSRNKYRRAQRPCDDCFGPLHETMTVSKVVELLNRGDA